MNQMKDALIESITPVTDVYTITASTITTDILTVF